MASRLQLNGWHRLWLAASAGVAIWFVAVWPLQYLKDKAPNRHEYDRGIERDFESGRCLIYQTATMEMLPEPAGRDCLHIYLSRKFDNTVPYTLEAYKIYSSARDREQYLAALAVGAAGTAIVSGFVYFFGWLVGRILTGFRGSSIDCADFKDNADDHVAPRRTLRASVNGAG